MPMNSLNIKTFSSVAQLKREVDEGDREVSELHETTDGEGEKGEGEVKQEPDQLDLAVDDEPEEEYHG